MEPIPLTRRRSDRTPGTAPRSAPCLAGAVVAGRYQIGEVLAWGGMGVVCEARHLVLEQDVAVKFIREELLGDEQALARFLNEAQAAASLRSEHIARVTDFGSLPSGVAYLVMDRLHGADLAALLRRGRRLPVRETADYVLQACEALAEAHAASIVHRDIKPENLFIARTPDGGTCLKVLDFGISKRAGVTDLTRPGDGVGSPFYMSPEQMRAPQEVDARADVWALGVVLYQALTGRLPFDGPSVPVVCARVLSWGPVPPRALRPDLPPDLEAVVLGCLRKPREERYASVAELAHALVPYGTPGRARESAFRAVKILQSPRKAAGGSSCAPDGARAGAVTARSLAFRGSRWRTAVLVGFMAAVVSALSAKGLGWFEWRRPSQAAPVDGVPELDAGPSYGRWRPTRSGLRLVPAAAPDLAGSGRGEAE